jgi:hypothetical protein
MPYIKISDPNIIDLSAWHQVISVINQHSDTLSAITNNYGVLATGSTNWNGETEIYEEFTPGSQKILFGRVTINTTGDNKDPQLESNKMFYQKIDFDNNVTSTASFSAKPIVIVTASIAGTPLESGVPNARNAGLVCTVTETTQSKFVVRIIKAKELPADVASEGTNSTVDNPRPSRTFYINWIAIGPK